MFLPLKFSRVTRKRNGDGQLAFVRVQPRSLATENLLGKGSSHSPSPCRGKWLLGWVYKKDIIVCNAKRRRRQRRSSFDVGKLEKPQNPFAYSSSGRGGGACFPSKWFLRATERGSERKRTGTGEKGSHDDDNKYCSVIVIISSTLGIGLHSFESLSARQGGGGKRTSDGRINNIKGKVISSCGASSFRLFRGSLGNIKVAGLSFSVTLPLFCQIVVTSWAAINQPGNCRPISARCRQFHVSRSSLDDVLWRWL